MEGESSESNHVIVSPGIEYLYGDVTGDEIVDAFDAANVLQYVVGLNTEGAPLPWTWEMIAGDVYGNPRVYGNGIDIGAVEWQGTPVNFDDIVQKPMDIMVYPNPVISSRLRDGCVKIEYSGEFKTADAKCVIYNVKGQRLRELKIENGKLKMECGRRVVAWDLCDDSGNCVSSGVYFIRIKDRDCYVSQRKVTVVR